MKKRVAIVIGLIALLMVASAPSGSYAKKRNEPARPDLTILNVKAWDEAVYKLVPPPTENGNAMAYFLEAIHFGFDDSFEDIRQGREEPSGTKIPYSWWEKITGVELNSEDPEVKAIAAEAIKIPELDLLVKGSFQKNYQWVGIYAVPSPRADRSLLEMKIPRHLDIWILAHILEARALNKLANKDISGAEADLLAMMRVGHSMQKDIDMSGYMIGQVIELRASKQLFDLYRKAGNEINAKAWEDLIPVIRSRHKESRNYIKYVTCHWPDEKELMSFVDDDSLPPAIRSSSMKFMLLNYFFKRPKTLLIKGVPHRYKEFLLTDHFENPELVIIQLKLIEDVYIGVYSGIKYLKQSRRYHDAE